MWADRGRCYTIVTARFGEKFGEHEGGEGEVGSSGYERGERESSLVGKWSGNWWQGCGRLRTEGSMK